MGTLFEYRVAHRYTQTEAARVLDVGARSISRWENGEEPNAVMKLHLQIASDNFITDWKKYSANGSEGAA